MGRLEGKRVLVTGAAEGQGRAVTLRFLAEGAHVLAADKSKDGLDELIRFSDLGHASRLVVQVLDVSVEEQVVAAVGAAGQEFGGLDVLYNNAGIYLRDAGDGPTHDISRQVWDEVLAVNTTGVFLCAKHCIPIMSRRGSIINVASINGLVASDCHAYSASKGAVIALTRSLAYTYGPNGIRANAIAAGIIETGMVRHLTEDPHLGRGFLRDIPLGRWGSVDDVADLAVFLASDESRYITGATIPIEGGSSIRP